MKKIGLSVYLFKVSEKRRGKEKNNILNINNIEGRSFLDILLDFFKEYEGQYDDDKKKENIFTTIKTDKKEAKDEDGRLKYGYVWSYIKTGDYGTVSEIVNADTGETSYNKKENDAEVIPFVCGIMLPSGERDNGIIIFQTEGKYGMKSCFESRLKKYLMKNYRHFSFEMGPLLPTQYIEKVLKKGVLEKIRLIRFQTPADIKNTLSVNEGTEMKEERIYYRPTGFINNKLDKIVGYIRGRNGLREVITDENFNYDLIKMDFKIGNRKRTFDFNNIEKIVPIIDITEEVKSIAEHPDYVLVKNEIEKTALEFWEEMQPS